MDRVRNIKILGLALAAVFALSAITSASAMAASAPRWKVAGSFLGTGVTKNFTANNSGTITLKGGELTLTSTSCSSTGKIEGTGAGVAGTNKETTLSCTGVKVVGFESFCQAHSPGAANGTITTNQLKGTLVYLTKKSTKSVGVLFLPASGTEFVKVEVVGAECPLIGNYPVTGEIVGKFKQEGESEFEEGELEFPATRISSYFANAETETATAVNVLKLGANNASFTGLFKIHLEPKEKVGVFPG